MTELLVFGVDGLNPDLVQTLTEKGEMPNFKQLQDREQTVYGDFESYICDGFKVPHTGPMWTSLYTGLKPEEHGLTSGGWSDGDSKFHVLDTVWDKLSEETDKDITLYGMPMTYKAKPIQGRMVSGFISPTIKPLWSNCVYPESLEEELPDDFIENTSSYITEVKTDGARPNADSQKFFEQMRSGERRRILDFEDFVVEKDADIVAYGTTLVDKMGHVAGISEDSEYAVKSYKLLDELLGTLLKLLQPTDVAIISDHGFNRTSHSTTGYYLDTSGRGMDNVFDFTPYLLDMYDVKYDKNWFGPTENTSDLTSNEVEDIKDQLNALGYF